MKTERWTIDPAELATPASRDVLERAARTLRGGRLVAFPTETVYGLGAHALDPAAVAAIYRAKGRPSRNPLIVHVGSVDQARALVTAWPDEAAALAAAFWPGPLTMVLPKQAVVPDVTTGGGATVALRVPAHPIARALIEHAAIPLAAPSANASNGISPTTADHVLHSLDGRIDAVLDGGACAVGVESTVVSLVAAPTLLRPGGLPIAAIEACIGPLVRAVGDPTAAALPSPGMLARHYAPRATLTLHARGDDRAAVAEALAAHAKVAWLPIGAPTALRLDGLGSTEAPDSEEAPAAVWTRPMPSDAAAYASILYATLHDADAWGADRIVVEAPPPGDEWLAVRDRLARAAQG